MSGIHTMKDDMIAAPKPSRFDLRHSRSLPKSKRMEDLRTSVAAPASANYPLPANNKPQTLQTPVKEQNILSNPILLWMLGITLGLIFSTIIFAIMIIGT